MTAEEMARAYSGASEWDAWAFGSDPDGLAALVLSGRKRATSSAWPLYAPEGEALPREGEYSVILNSREEAVCMIRTVRVRVVPFSRVDARHARLEGEGDLTLNAWRRAHRRFFSEEMAEAGLTFDESMPVVCEEFEVVYPEQGAL